MPATITAGIIPKPRQSILILIDASLSPGLSRHKGQPSIRPFTAYGQAASNLKRYFKVGKTLEVAAAFEGATLRVRGRRFGSRAADAARAAA